MEESGLLKMDSLFKNNVVSSTPYKELSISDQLCANTSGYSTDKNISSETDEKENHEEPKLDNNVSLPPKAITSSLSPRSGQNEADFCKTPNQTGASPSSFKIAEYSHQLPLAPRSSSKKQFRHVVSPIGAYIKQSAEIPLFKTVKFKNATISKSSDKVSDESSQSPENLSLLAAEAKTTLPRKKCTAAPRKRIVDNRHLVIPGDEAVKKLIGYSPLVIRHNKRIKSGQNDTNQQSADENTSDLSDLSGDESVLIVNHAQRSKN